jgi:hypothetical protein
MYPVKSSERKTLKVSFHDRPKRMRQLVTFGELSHDVYTTRTGSMCVATSRVAISYGCPAVLERNMDVSLLYGKAFVSGTTD